MRLGHIEGAILAGGPSSRMGRDKARVELAGVPLIEHVARALRACFERVVVVLGAEGESPIDLPTVRDAHAQRAPLVGVAAALSAAEAPWVLVAGCDLPLLDPALVLALCALAPLESEHCMVAPRGPEGPEPLLALYRTDLLARIEERIRSGRLALRELLEEGPTLFVPTRDLTCVDPALASLLNVNRQEDLERALAQTEGGST